MVQKDNFSVLSDEEKAKYEFKFCQHCRFYKCELISEYLQYRENHKSQRKNTVAVKTIYDGYAKLAEQAQLSNNADELNEKNILSNKAVRNNTNVRIIPLESVNTQLSNNDSTTGVDSNDENILSYNKDVLKNGCHMYRCGGCLINQIECGNKYVRDGIGDHYQIDTGNDNTIKNNTEDRWEPSQPVFISAQTGQGKNYFIENTLIPYVRDMNYKKNTKQKILILSNRLALKYQIKNRLGGNNDVDDEDDIIFSYCDCADVMTYQGLLHKEDYLKKLQEKKPSSRYIFVICDEAHFFTSDAMFNPHTYNILSMIVRLFKDAVRVYMSATPYECLKPIIDCEDQYQNLLNKDRKEKERVYCNMVFYHFTRDYNYLDIKSYSAIKELYKEMVDSVKNRKEKWLIFIDDREKCEEVKKELEAFAQEQKMPLTTGEEAKHDNIEQVFAVNASSKNDPIYMSIVHAEQLNKNVSVLITTSVLDNGVNLKGIHNIVVSEMSKVKCLQMVGRARVDGEDNRKTLYIKRFSSSEPAKIINALKRQEDAYHIYNLAYGKISDDQSKDNNKYKFLNKYYDSNERDWNDAKHWFGRNLKDPNELYLNKTAASMLDYLIPQYEQIYDEIKEEEATSNDYKGQQDPKYFPGQKYLEYQLSWFAKTYNIDDDITYADKEKSKKEFIYFLEEYVNSELQIDKESQEKFKEMFTKLHDSAFGRADRNLERTYGIRKMNGLLEDQNLNYEIVNKKSYWIVCKSDSSLEPENES